MKFSLRTWIRGLALLRRPLLVHHFGMLTQRLELIERLRVANPGAQFDDDIILVGCEHADIKVGAGSRISSGTLLVLGDEQFGYGRLQVGVRTWIGQYTNLRMDDGTHMLIGDDCLIGQFSTLLGSQHAREPGTPIREQGTDQRRRNLEIGNDVWVGSGVSILPGIKIGDGAIIGANSMVTCDVPAGEIWAGVPARKVRDRA